MSDTSFLNWPFLDDRHRALAIDIDAWSSANMQRLTEHEEEDLDGTCRDIVKALGNAGFLHHAVSLGEGPGGKLDVRSLCLLRETLGRHHALADFAFAMQGLGSGPISLFGSPQQQSQFLPAVASGDALAAFALSEPEAGSDVRAMTTQAEERADHFIINGEKTWISNAGLANFYTVFARTGESGGTKDICCFIVQADNPGLRVSKRIELIAPHPIGTLVFENCIVPRENLVGSIGSGLGIAMATLDVFRTTVAAAALGMARRALDETLSHVARRKVFGGVLSDLQLVQGKLSDMAVGIDSSALLVYRSAWTKDCLAQRVTREAAMAKLHATESAQQVIDAAVQLHGGMGVTKGHIIESLYRDVRALRIYEGASEVQQTIIARQTLAGHIKP
ncbi:MAG: acyl-CoA dehydrogenase family protein [Porticoccaceae bacterium]|nr:acyl-CoA dehydrogenase family protein [Porticoccaceae bacterium]